MRHIVIIGNGIAGITAARFLRKWSDDRITVISSETDHHYARTALMYIYMGHMTFEDTKPYEDWFWDANRIQLTRGYVTSVEPQARRVVIGGAAAVDYDVLVIASGSRPNMFDWPGQHLDGVQGLYGMPDLATMERSTKGIDHAVVVGGGLIGVEMAEMLRSRHIPVTFLVREDGYMDYLLPREESQMVGDEISDHGVGLRLSTELAAIQDDGFGRAGSVTTSEGESIACQFVGLAAGVHPNIGFLAGSGIETSAGVLVDEFFETSFENIYAVGDCAEFRDHSVAHRAVEQLWYTARRHGRAVARTISGKRTAYDRGVFFNSAKFFDLEYQTYGQVGSASGPDEQSIVAAQDSPRRLIRINFDRETRAVKGFNLLGVRFRHELCEHWIREGAKIEAVSSRLRDAAFDAEFTTSLEPAFLAAVDEWNQSQSVAA